MLPSPYRIPSPLIRRVLAKGTRTSVQELSLVSVRTKEAVSRFAFVVSVAIDTRATGRNRMKRLLRSAVHHLLPSIAPGYDVVFLVRRRFADRSEKEVELAVRTLLQRAGLLSSSP